MLNNFTPTEKTNQILLDQYKIFVESAQKISDNRIATVNYYIAILSGLLVAITAFFENVIVKTILCALGIIIAAALDRDQSLQRCKGQSARDSYLPSSLRPDDASERRRHNFAQQALRS